MCGIYFFYIKNNKSSKLRKFRVKSLVRNQIRDKQESKQVAIQKKKILSLKRRFFDSFSNNKVFVVSNREIICKRFGFFSQ